MLRVLNYILNTINPSNIILYQNCKESMYPIAYLLLNDLPNQNKLKNLRYFLGEGSNIMGSDPRCQIRIPYLSTAYLGNICINSCRNSLTIECFSAQAMQVHGNLSPSDRVLNLEVGVKYMPRLGESFYFAGIRATVATDTPANLARIKNIFNHSAFLPLPQSTPNYQLTINQQPNRIRDIFNHSAFLPYPQSTPNGQLTINQQPNHCDHAAYSQTLQINDDMYAYQPTIILQQALQTNIKKYVPPVCSQQQLLHEITQRQQQFSMPDTIIDQVEDRFSNNFHKSAPMNSLGMPPTIQQHCFSRIKHTQSFNADYHCPEPQQLVEEVDNFDDLFGVSKEVLPKESPVAPQYKQRVVPQDDMFGGSKEVVRKESAVQQKWEVVPEQSSRVRTMVSICNFKPTAMHKEVLLEQGYQIVSHPDDDYQILLVKEPLKLSNRLLRALISHKRIESDQWIFNKNSQITSRLQGRPWRSVYGRHATYEGVLKGRYYLTASAEELLSGVVAAMGGTQIEEIGDRKKALKVVMKVGEGEDMGVYLEWKSAKKWRFYRMEAIVDSVMEGEWVGDDEKYLLPD